MIQRWHTGTATFDEFCDLIREDQKADLLEGVIYLASPESTDHNKLVRWLTIVIGQFVEERKLGEITVNKVSFRLSDHDAPEPDVGFIATENQGRIKPGYVDGPPDLAIEIVSPDSPDRDYEIKRHRYEAAGVREYWIIDPIENTTTFLSLNGDEFVELTPHDNIFQSHVLEGFRLDVRWLFQRPLPPTMPIVRQLLENH